MTEKDAWAFPRELQPRAAEVEFDLSVALNAVVALRADVAEDAFTASILGTERTGNGVVIGDDGLILTIGYLITEAETIWLTANDGTVVQGYPLAYDFTSGFGLVQPLGRLGVQPLVRGSAALVETDDDVIVIGHGGLAHALKARIIDKREFAGYWEYVLDEALFTAPAHPEWSGAALVGNDGRLIGIGSLLVQEQVDEDTVHGNMFVPIDLLAPIVDDLTRQGRRSGPVRPWLGLYTAEVKERLVVSALASGGPAERAGVRPGDIVLEVGGQRVSELATFYRAMWRLGPAGTEIPLVLIRDGVRVVVRVHSADRGDFLKKPSLQ
ncbi:MAG TPA: S1C family serine protease [Casimicrobiaceae bacterium]|jgi:S1-C subfamily serine protease